jgi:hypothetical protein
LAGVDRERVSRGYRLLRLQLPRSRVFGFGYYDVFQQLLDAVFQLGTRNKLGQRKLRRKQDTIERKQLRDVDG